MGTCMLLRRYIRELDTPKRAVDPLSTNPNESAVNKIDFQTTTRARYWFRALTISKPFLFIIIIICFFASVRRENHTAIKRTPRRVCRLVCGTAQEQYPLRSL